MIQHLLAVSGTSFFAALLDRVSRGSTVLLLALASWAAIVAVMIVLWRGSGALAFLLESIWR